MLISEVIQRIKDYCGGYDMMGDRPIDEATTRDKVLYGNVDQECTGIVTCIWATADVIRQAQELGANLIIPHEALFWNHGDHQDVVAENATFQAKRNLLNTWGGAVWRCHDYIHSGAPLDADGALADGIFYGFAWKMGWLEARTGDIAHSMDFEIPETTGQELAHDIVERLGLAGVRLVGDPSARVRRVQIPMHVMGGPQDTALANATDTEGGPDCLLGMEFIDFTTCEYIRDAAQLGHNKCAIVLGHFNPEEPGMEHMATWIPSALGAGAPQVSYVSDGDTYHYVTCSEE